MNEKIPKIIHYCWFGQNPLNELAVKCIRSWEKYCPDFTFIRWDESNFDIQVNQYVKEAYENKKWAFVTDYVRLFALDNHGGIYMDTDVELLKNIDFLLKNSAFTGFETDDRLQTAFMGAIPKHPWIKEIMASYDERYFILSDGSLDITTNVTTITEITQKKYQLVLGNQYQELPDGLVIYKKDFFSPKDYDDFIIRISTNTCCIHHFNASWHTEDERKFHQKKIRYEKLFGKKVGIHFWALDKSLYEIGFLSTISKYTAKIINCIKKV